MRFETIHDAYHNEEIKMELGFKFSSSMRHTEEHDLEELTKRTTRKINTLNTTIKQKIEELQLETKQKTKNEIINHQRSGQKKRIVPPGYPIK